MRNTSKIIIILVSILILLLLADTFLLYRINVKEIEEIPGVNIYRTVKGTGYNKYRYGVYIPKVYSSSKSLPLIVASHGANSDGESEIEDWKEIAEQYGVIVVTPSYACATNKAKDNEEKKLYIKQEKKMLKEILEKVTSDLNIDRRYVMHTGFSGGGTSTWYIATSFPKVFNAFCLQSANFYGRDFSPIHHLVTWRDIPVYIFWSKNDNEVLTGDGYKTKIGEGQETLNFMKKKKFTRLKHKIFKRGGHIPRREEAARWFVEEVIGNK